MISIAMPYLTIALAEGKVTARPCATRHFRLPSRHPLREDRTLSCWHVELLFALADTPGDRSHLRALCEVFFYRYTATYSGGAPSPDAQQRVYDNLMRALRRLT